MNRPSLPRFEPRWRWSSEALYCTRRIARGGNLRSSYPIKVSFGLDSSNRKPCPRFLWNQCLPQSLFSLLVSLHLRFSLSLVSFCLPFSFSISENRGMQIRPIYFFMFLSHGPATSVSHSAQWMTWNLSILFGWIQCLT